jgi:hypothetical protein
LLGVNIGGVTDIEHDLAVLHLARRFDIRSAASRCGVCWLSDIHSCIARSR